MPPGKRFYRKKNYRKKAPKRRSGETFTKRVMRVIAGEAETKMKIVQVYNHSIVQGAGRVQSTEPGIGSKPGLATENLFTTLSLTRGDDQENIIGNQITKRRSGETFTKRVMRVIAGEAETKMKIVQVYNHSIVQGAGRVQSTEPGIGSKPGLATENLFTTLSLTRGDDQENIIGNQITDCRLKVRGFIRSNSYNSTYNPAHPLVDQHFNTSNLPYEVHVVFYKKKTQIQNDDLSIKSAPSNLTIPVDASVMNTLYPWNKDTYVIKKHRVFRMRPLTQETTHNQINGQQSNAPMFQRFHMDIPIKKKLIFNDGSYQPSNDWVGVMIYVVNGDGTALVSDPSTTAHPNLDHIYDERCSITMDAILTYKDY